LFKFASKESKEINERFFKFTSNENGENAVNRVIFEKSEVCE